MWKKLLGDLESNWREGFLTGKLGQFPRGSLSRKVVYWNNVKLQANKKNTGTVFSDSSLKCHRECLKKILNGIDHGRRKCELWKEARQTRSAYGESRREETQEVVTADIRRACHPKIDIPDYWTLNALHQNNKAIKCMLSIYPAWNKTDVVWIIHDSDAWI